jgi:hypothetical protein
MYAIISIYGRDLPLTHPTLVQGPALIWFRKHIQYFRYQTPSLSLLVSLSLIDVKPSRWSKWMFYVTCYSKIPYALYTECPRRNVPDFGRVFLMLKYTDITQNTYIQSWTVTEIMVREKCGLLVGPRTVPVSWQSYQCPSLSAVSYNGDSATSRQP